MHTLASDDMKQKTLELRGETDQSSILDGDSNSYLSVINRTNRQKIQKFIEEINNTVNHLKQMGI